MEEVLREIGLSKNEMLVYITLSKIGPSSAYQISKQANVFKSNTYDVVVSLVQKGLISEKVENNKKIYSAADPSFLLNQLDDKREKVNNIIPQLRLLQQNSFSEHFFNIYEGVQAHINILRSFLDGKNTIYSYGLPKDVYSYVKGYIDVFHKERIKKKIKMYHIYNSTANESMQRLKKLPLTPLRCLPSLYDSEVSTIICGDTVLFTLWKSPLKTILIKEKSMAESYMNYFKILWSHAK